MDGELSPWLSGIDCARKLRRPTTAASPLLVELPSRCAKEWRRTFVWLVLEPCPRNKQANAGWGLPWTPGSQSSQPKRGRTLVVKSAALSSVTVFDVLFSAVSKMHSNSPPSSPWYRYRNNSTDKLGWPARGWLGLPQLRRMIGSPLDG